MRWDFGREFGFEYSGLSLSYFLFSLVRRGAKRTQRFGLQLKRVISLQPPGFNQVFIAISNNLGIDSIELSHWTSFVVTTIIRFALVWWIGLMLLNLNCILFLFYFFICVFLFSHSFIVAYKLFDKISLSIYKWINVGTKLNHIFKSI